MRLSTALHSLVAVAFLATSLLLMTGTWSTSGLYAALQRVAAGVDGRPSQARHTVTAETRIAPLDGYTYAGQLDATLTFVGADGAETVFDLHYPGDYNFFHDGFGPLWLANWRWDIANNPQFSPVLGNSCLQPVQGEALNASRRYRTGYAEYIVCRVLDEEPPDASPVYDIARAAPAVIGVLWANRNHQPIDYPRARCVAEARIWAMEIAKPGDRFMACLLVVDDTMQAVETVAFELTDSRIVEVGGAGESWPRSQVKTRDATRLAQYRLMQSWLADPEAHRAAADRAYAHVVANRDQMVPQRISRFDSVAQRQGVVYFTFSAKDTAAMTRLRDRFDDSDARHLYKHIRRVVCGSDERAALLAFQENVATYMYALNRSDGRPITQFATFPNLPC